MRTILVVGSSKGIGHELSKILVESNKVIGISRSASGLGHGNFEEHLLDASKEDLPPIEKLDGLVYCPGTINLKPFSRLSQDDFMNDFKVNVMGAVRVLQHYEKSLKKGDHASVVLFSTVASAVGMPFHASVAVSKSGVEGLVKSLAAEWVPRMRINAIAPTLTNTPLASGILRNEEAKNRMEQRHPMKRILEAREVAQFAEFLLSENAISQTGQIFPLDCGMVSVRT